MISSGNISTSNRNDSGLSRKRTVSAAGRMVKEGGKNYEYGWLDKVLAVRENDKKIASFNYQVDGQIAQAIHGDQSEEFFWDGLALIHRGETSFINEPYVTGGNPILSSKDGVMFNDMLGSTLNIGGKAIHMTAFGESSDTNALFTGKPYIGELGYAFLFRNYRADQGKWQTTDPLGYPDGWNNLAYCGNKIIDMYDRFGMCPDGFPASVSVERTLIGEPIYGPFTYTFDSTNNTYTLYLPWSIHYKENIFAIDVDCGCICMGQHCGVHHVDESSEEHQLSAPLYNMIVFPTEEVNENNLEKFMNDWMEVMIKNIKKSISDFLDKGTTIVRVACE